MYTLCDMGSSCCGLLRNNSFTCWRQSFELLSQAQPLQPGLAAIHSPSFPPVAPLSPYRRRNLATSSSSTWGDKHTVVFKILETAWQAGRGGLLLHAREAHRLLTRNKSVFPSRQVRPSITQIVIVASKTGQSLRKWTWQTQSWQMLRTQARKTKSGHRNSE